MKLIYFNHILSNLFRVYYNNKTLNIKYMLLLLIKSFIDHRLRSGTCLFFFINLVILNFVLMLCLTLHTTANDLNK